MAIADKINKGLAARRAEENAQRQRHADQAGDRETPGHEVGREEENIAQEQRVDDQRYDRDGGTGRDTGMTLAERIDAEMERRREKRNTHPRVDDKQEGRSL